MKYFKIILLITFLVTTAKMSAELYAVVVGVTKYKDPTENLRYAASEAKKFYDLLTNNKPSPNIVLLIDEKATRSNILNVMNNTFKKAKPTDRIIFFFSGHGRDGFFCPYDAGEDASSLLKHEDIQNAFKRSNAGVKMCIGDACFAGSIRNNPKTTKTTVNFFKSSLEKSVTKKDNIIVFMSSRGNQYSQESYIFGQGLFTYYLIQSFLGKADADKDNKVTAKEMYTYVRYNVSAKTNNSQIPIMFGRFSENTVIVAYK